jgi:hypothetical protein
MSDVPMDITHVNEVMQRTMVTILSEEDACLQLQFTHMSTRQVKQVEGVMIKTRKKRRKAALGFMKRCLVDDELDLFVC